MPCESKRSREFLECLLNLRLPHEEPLGVLNAQAAARRARLQERSLLTGFVAGTDGDTYNPYPPIGKESASAYRRTNVKKGVFSMNPNRREFIVRSSLAVAAAPSCRDGC